MIKIQQHLVDLELNSQYESAIFNLDVPVNTEISIINGSFNVNGVDVPSPTIIDPTSNVQVKLLTPTTYVTTLTAIITAGNDQYIVSGTTKTDPTQTHLPGSINISPFDYLTHPNGYTVTPYSSSNVLSKLKPDNTYEYLTLSNIQTNDFYPTDIKEHSFVFSCNFFTDSLYLLDTTIPLETSLVGKITLDEGARPSGGITDHVSNHLYIAQSGLNSVLIIDRPTGTIVDTIVVGNKPMSIIQDTQHRIWVANYDSNTVSLIVNDIVTNTINVGIGPLELTLDSSENVWVTNSKTNTISRIDAITLIATTITVGTNPWGICLFNGNIVVANSYSDTLSIIDPITSNVINTINVSSTPYSLSCTSTILYVACYSNAIVEQYSTVFTKIHTTNINKYPYDIQLDNSNNIWIMEYYSNIPSRTVDIDQNAIQFSFLHLNNAYISTNYTSNEIIIEGIYSSVPASIPAINGHSLYKNNINVGFNTTVVNGDILKISTTSSTEYSDTNTIQLTIGDVFADYTITTEPYNIIVNSFIFDSVTNATVNTSYSSNIITISGLSHNITVPLTISNGSIIKNGIPIGISTTVKNDDTIQISLNSSIQDNTPTFSEVNIGGVLGIFSVLTTGPNIFNVTPDLILEELTDQPTNILENSNELLISGLPIFVPPDPQTEPPTIAPVYTLSIDPYPNTNIIKNGINVGTSTTINNGDIIGIRTYSSLYNGFKSQINLYVGNIVSTWNITTTYNPPLPFIFQDQYNIVPRDTVLSNIVPIFGLDPNKITEVFIPYGRLIINGLPSTDNIIENGDNIQWEVSAKGPYGGIRTYKLSVGGTSLQTGVISTWKIGTRSLLYSVYFEDINVIHTNSLPAVFNKSITNTNISIDTDISFTHVANTNIPIDTDISFTHVANTNIPIDTNILFTHVANTNIPIDTNILFTHVANTNISIDTDILLSKSNTNIPIDTNISFTHVANTHVVIDTDILLSKSNTNIPIDVVLTKTSNVQFPIDVVLTKTSNIQLPIDVVLTKTSNVQLPVNLLLTKSKNNQLPIELILTKTDSVQLPIELILTKTDNIQLPIEIICTKNNDVQLPVEIVLTKTGSVQVPVNLVLMKTNNVQLPVETVLTKTNINQYIINKQYYKSNTLVKPGIITTGSKSTNTYSIFPTFGGKTTNNPKDFFIPNIYKSSSTIINSYVLNVNKVNNSNYSVNNIEPKLTINTAYTISNVGTHTHTTNITHNTTIYKSSVPIITYSLGLTELFDDQMSFGIFEDNGTFNTSELALQAAFDLGYSNPSTYQLTNGKYIWLNGDLMCDIILPPIHNPNNERFFLHGYRQGG